MSLIERSNTRTIKFTTNINPYADGSVLVEFGNTKVQVTAMVEEGVPKFMKGQGKGWLTAEYSMLPSATHTRGQRERTKVGGRTMEIQRIIGRSLRSIVDLEKLGENTLTIDCDVLVADGGTRTASISGAYVALSLAAKKLMDKKKVKANPIKAQVAAISIGINKNGKIIADLNYEEDSTCEADVNVVMTSDGRFIEVQGTAEGDPFTADQLQAIFKCAELALPTVFNEQNRVL